MIFYVVREMREGVTLGFAAFVGHGFVATGEAYGLDRQEADLLGIVERELDDASYLFVVDAVHDRDDRDNLDPGFMQVIDGLQLHIEQVPDFAMRIGSVADAVELKVGIAHAGFGGLLRELKALGEFD